MPPVCQKRFPASRRPAVSAGPAPCLAASPQSSAARTFPATQASAQHLLKSHSERQNAPASIKSDSGGTYLQSRGPVFWDVCKSDLPRRLQLPADPLLHAPHEQDVVCNLNLEKGQTKSLNRCHDRLLLAGRGLKNAPAACLGYPAQFD